MYCPNCAAEVNTIVREVTEIYPVKGENIAVNARVRFCTCCGTDLWDDELDDQNILDAYAKYRQKHNLMQPADIRAMREKYHLSQTAFARVLGLGDKTITRYENGSIPDAAPNNLLDLVQQPSNFAALLEKNKSKISEQDYEHAREALDGLRRCVISPRESAKVKYSTNENMRFYFDKYWGDMKYA